MSSEQISLIAGHPFIQKFVFAILRSVSGVSIPRDERYVIHADLVPKVSERVMERSIASRDDREQKIEDRRGLDVVPKKPVVTPPRVPFRRIVPPRVPVRSVMPQRVVPPRPQITPPPAKGDVGLSQDYGKIMPLLNDASVSTIECQGAGKALMIIRAGQRQITRISLSAGEIKDVLDKVSETVHIPILEGVFRAAVDNFSLNAVVSEIIGSRFVIKKQNAYALLE